MLFITNRTKKVNANFIKELDINSKAEDHVFSIKMIDNMDNIETLDVDVLEMIKSECAGVNFANCDFEAFSKAVKDKTIEDFEQSNCLETALETCENKLRSTIKEINIEDLVYDNFLKLADTYLSK